MIATFAIWPKKTRERKYAKGSRIMEFVQTARSLFYRRKDADFGPYLSRSFPASYGNPVMITGP